MRVLKRLSEKSDARHEWFFDNKNLLVMLAILALGVCVGLLTLQIHGDVWLAAGYIFVVPMLVVALLTTPPKRRSAASVKFPSVVLPSAFESAEMRPFERPPLS